MYVPTIEHREKYTTVRIILVGKYILTLQGWVPQRVNRVQPQWYISVTFELILKRHNLIVLRTELVVFKLACRTSQCIRRLQCSRLSIVIVTYSVWKRLTAANRFETRVPRKRILHKIFMIANKTFDCGLNTCAQYYTFIETHSIITREGCVGV